MNRGQDADPRFAQLERELADVVRRLEALEARASLRAQDAQDGHDAQPLAPTVEPSTDFDLTAWAPLVGRSFIVVGGAYLLRALTEGGTLPMAAGAGLGLLYACVWLWAANRDGHRGRRLSAQVHGATAVLVGWPLVWEATARFGIFSAGAAAVVLLVLTALAYVVAHRVTMPVLAGVAGFGTVAAALAVAMSTDAYGAVSLLLVTLGSVTYWVSDAPARGWLRWPVAIAAGVSVMAVTSRTLATPPREAVGMALLAQAWLLATMQGSLAVRCILFRRPARFFDMMQAASGLAIGIGGAVLVAREAGSGLTLVGAITALFAAGAYLAAYLRLADTPRLLTSYYSATTFGVVALVAALFMVLEGPALAAVALALTVMAFLSPAHVRTTLLPHGAWLLVVALQASGAFPLAWTAWVGTPSAWPVLSVPAVGTIGACLALIAWLRLPEDGGAAGEVARAALLVATGLMVAAAGGVCVVLLASLLAGTPPDAGVLASVRTGVVAVIAVALGASARWSRLRLPAALVYPVLAAGGIRLFADDFLHSEPSTLFIALAMYGAALLLAPRMATRV